MLLIPRALRGYIRPSGDHVLPSQSQPAPAVHSPATPQPDEREGFGKDSKGERMQVGYSFAEKSPQHNTSRPASSDINDYYYSSGWC